MKKLTAIILAMTLALSLAACGGGSPSPSLSPSPSSPSPSQGALSPSPGGTDPTPTDTDDPSGSPQDTTPPAGVAVGDIMEFGGYEWRVLEVSGGKALLLSEYIIEDRLYHDAYAEVTWADCDLRAYLNGEFYLGFSEGDRAKITQTRSSNKDNQWYGTPGGDDTDDYIFLLSLEEVVRYFGDSGQLANRPSEDAKYIDDQYNEARLAYTLDGVQWAWWLRSPGYDVSNIAYVRFGMGVIMMNGNADSDVLGLRPAMWVSLE
ncbi:MAG: DUF6273 domain-containing protein [Oscillospiraceae bacterium]|nr:DUF6273 domain-containing protein [Oscillospiraceae bacterium]